MSFVYNYSLADDFGGSLNNNRLEADINASNGVTPLCTAVTVDEDSDNVAVVFVAALSGVQQNNLNSLVAAHVGAADPSIEYFSTGAYGTKLTLISNQTENRTQYLPDASGTLVLRSTADVLQNKTIDAAQNTVTNVKNSAIAPNAGINASKLANGTVSNAELQSLDGVTGNIQTQLNSKSAVGHTHVAADVTDFQSAVSGNGDVLANVAHAADAAKHRTINDAGTGNTDLWSASKISNQLANKTDVGHTHSAADVTNFATAADARIQAQKEQPNGLATLDATGKVPASQLSLDSIDYQGTWNAETNTPTLTSGNGSKGHYYVVSVAGNTTIDGIDDWQANDWIIFNGSFWEKADHTDQVTSVAGKTGEIELVASDVNDFQAAVANNSAVAANTAHAADDAKHRLIDDFGVGPTDLWSAEKISAQLATKSAADHTHVASDVTNFESAVESNTQVAANTAHRALTDNPHNVTKAQIGLADVPNLKSNLTANVAPTTIDDSSAGYAVGSGWINQTTGRTYQCVDASVGAAVWRQLGIETHADLSGVGVNTHSQIDTHIADASVHFTKSSINHDVLQNVGSNSHAQIDSHLADVTKHRVINDAGVSSTQLWSAAKINAEVSSRSALGHTHSATDVTDLSSAIANHVEVAANTTHRSLTNNPHSITKAQIGLGEVDNLKNNLSGVVGPTPTDDSDAGYSVGSLWVDASGKRSYRCVDDSVGAAVWRQTGIESHAFLADIGSNTHAQIDAHIADSTVHFTEASIDHTALQNVGSNSHAQIDEHISDATKHRVINDASTSNADLWSASKISSQLATKSAIGHTHTAANITNFDAEVANNVQVATNSAHRSRTDNPHAVSKTQVGLSNVPNLKVKLDAAEPPSLNDDSNSGYAVGSTWIDVLADRHYVCVDASVGAAQWRQGIENHADLDNVGSNTHAQIDAHIADANQHRVINDSGTSATQLWSANKINNELLTKSAVGHSHVATDITDFSAAADARIAVQKGAANGVATLDSNGKVPASQLDLTNVQYQSTWDAATNTPELTDGTGTKGHYYVVNVAGATDFNGISDWQVGDWIIYNGTAWEKVDNTDQVSSVAGKQGAVTLVAADTTDFQAAVSSNVSVVANSAHAADDAKHREIDDSANSSTALWSAAKIGSELLGKSGVGHTHVADDITDFEAAVAANSSVTLNTAHRQLSNNPHAVTKAQVGLGNVPNLLGNFNATTGPTASDDASEGYAVGSVWADVDGDRYYVCVDSSNSAAVWKDVTLQAGESLLSSIGAATYQSIQDMHNVTNSAGSLSGGAIVDAGSEQVNVAAGTGLVRPTNSSTAQLQFFDWTAANSLAVPTDDIRYVGVEYNGGAPQIVLRANNDFNNNTDFFLGCVVNENGLLHIVQQPHAVGSSAKFLLERLAQTEPLAKDRLTGGLQLSETAGRHLSLSAGRLWGRLSVYDIASIDTSDVDTFDAYFRDGSGGFSVANSQTVYSNTEYDNGSGTLQPLGSGQYGVHWLFLTVDGNLLLLFGQESYDSAAEADGATVPAQVPPRFEHTAVLLGRVIYQESAGVSIAVQTLLGKKCIASTVGNDHNNLANLQGGVDGEHYHLSSAEHSATLAHLTDTNNPHSVTKAQVGLGKVSNLKSETDATVPPSAVDDTTAGFAIGSLWIDTAAQTAYQCVDATANSAVWRRTDISSTSDVVEGSNLYYTDSRFDARLASKDTDQVSEGGSNLYYTEARVADNSSVVANTEHRALTNNPHLVTAQQVGLGKVSNVKSNLSASVAPSANDDSSAGYSPGSLWIDVLAGKVYHCVDDSAAAAVWRRADISSTSDIDEGSNLFYTTARFDDRLAVKSTDDLAEGSSNLYFTDLRVDSNSNVTQNTVHRSRIDNPHQVSKAQIGLSEVANIKSNYAATGPPTATDDTGAGFSIGSHWIDTLADRHYVCVDATEAGAVWRQGIEDHNDLANVGSNSHAQIDAHIANDAKHRVIDDTGTGTTDLWSASKIGNELDTKADTGHTHLAADITDFVGAADARIALQKGQQNGLATLDSNGKVPASQLDLDSVDYQGAWNAAANVPSLSSGVGDKGQYYVVSIAGTTEIDGIDDWQVGDWFIFNGTVWQKTDNSDQVTSVAGKQGVVTLIAADIDDFDVEVANQTDVVQNTAHRSLTNNPHSVTAAQLGLGDVSNLKSNLSATVAPVNSDDSSAGYSVGSLWIDTDANRTYQCVDSTSGNAVWRRTDIASTSDMTEGSNLYYTAARFDARLATKNTDDLVEGDNLYYTESRVNNNSNVAANTGHRSRTDNPHNVTAAQIGLGDVSNLKAKLDATSAPNNNDDFNDGFSVGSVWIDVSGDRAYICADASVGAAVWRQIGVESHSELQGVGTNTHAQIDDHIADVAKHRVIDDNSIASTALWSASKISNQLAAKTNVGHTHSLNDLSDADLFENGGEDGGADRSLGNNDNFDLALKTNNIQRLVISKDGRIGLGSTPETDYKLTVQQVSGKEGVLVKAGGAEGDLSLNVVNASQTKQLLQVHANGGELVLGDSYSNVKTANGTVYGFDNQHSSGALADVNTVGRYRVAGRPTVLMTEYQDAASNDESSTTNTTFVQKLRMSTPSLPLGKYRIGWQLEFKNNHRRGGEYRVQINDSTTIAQAEGTDRTTRGFTTESGFYYASGVSGVQNIDIDFRAVRGTSFVQAARLEIWRIS